MVLVVGAVAVCHHHLMVGMGTKRKAMEKMDQRKQDRINKHKEALGIQPRKPR